MRLKNGDRLVQCYDFIVEYLDKHGISPSLAEMQNHFGFRSKSGVSRILNCLEDRNLIARDRHKSRSITVIKPPIKTVKIWSEFDLDNAVLGFLAANGYSAHDIINKSNPIQSLTINFKDAQPRCEIALRVEVRGEPT